VIGVILERCPGLKGRCTGTVANSYLYGGERFNSNLGLYHLRARFYNMLTGRFETMDPFGGSTFAPAKLHKYIYVANNPPNQIDPSGLDIIEVAFLYSRPGFSVLAHASIEFDPAALEDELADLGLRGTEVYAVLLNASFARGIGVCDAAALLYTSEILAGVAKRGNWRIKYTPGLSRRNNSRFSRYSFWQSHTLETTGSRMPNRFDLDWGPRREFEISINLRLAARLLGVLVLAVWGLGAVFGPPRWMFALTSRPVLFLLAFLVLFLLKC
jgi:RHS repeat-associated protein